VRVAVGSDIAASLGAPHLGKPPYQMTRETGLARPRISRVTGLQWLKRSRETAEDCYASGGVGRVRPASDSKQAEQKSELGRETGTRPPRCQHFHPELRVFQRLGVTAPGGRCTTQQRALRRACRSEVKPSCCRQGLGVQRFSGVDKIKVTFQNGLLCRFLHRISGRPVFEKTVESSGLKQSPVAQVPVTVSFTLATYSTVSFLLTYLPVQQY